jgi:hypothetical protein
VARDVFLILLAVLTAGAGAVLLIMLVRRRRAARLLAARAAAAQHNLVAEAAARAAARARPVELAADAGARRTIDDYAIPVGFDSRPGLEDEVDIGKICPVCGARYASHHRFCQRCGDSELAALN